MSHVSSSAKFPSPHMFIASSGIADSVEFQSLSPQEHLDLAIDHLTAARAALDRTSVRCESCGLMHFANWPQAQADAKIQSLVDKLRILATAFANAVATQR